MGAARQTRENMPEVQSPNFIDHVQVPALLPYVADLEIEVDRLRRRDQFFQHEARARLQQILRRCKQGETPEIDGDPLAEIEEQCNGFSEVLNDLSEPPGYHPAFDQVIAVAVRPLAEQVFRWQQRLHGASQAVLRLDLSPDYICWFPARLRHILDNLMSNALRYRDSSKGETRVGFALRVFKEGYELRVTDNGVGMPKEHASGMLELFYRAAPARAAGLGVGLAVVKLLVEQCCGTVSVVSGEGQGTSVTVVLPRYDEGDHIG
jgi:signal transduction histidine kinase